MKKLAIMLLPFAAVAGELSLDGSWEFRFEEGKAHDEAADPRFEATDSIPVPGCFDAMPKWFMKRGTGLYRRTFSLDRAADRAWLRVDGAGLYARFWVDGREIGVDDLPWSRVEIATGPLAAGEHVLFAAVDNRFDWRYQKLVRTYYDFHCWGGFFRGVSLVFDNRRLHVRTRDFATGTVEIEAVDFPDMAGDAARELVFDGRNRVRAAFRNGRATVKVPGFRLWSPEAPNLHRVALDGVSARFGIRTVEAKNRGIYLNGRRIFLKGANRHDQHWQFGAATPESQMIADIQLLKQMGGNFFRGAHYPQSQRFLDLCDENGVLVWEESLGWGNGQGYTMQNGVNETTDPDFIDAQLRETKLMVRNSFNHPSVIIFAFLNEFASWSAEAQPLASNLVAAVRAADSGRLVTFACNAGGDDRANALTDLISINTYPGVINSPPGVTAELKEKIRNQQGFGLYEQVRALRAKHPEKTIIVSEMGAPGVYGARDVSAPFASEDFQAEYVGLVADAAYENPDLAGIAFWQFFDTRTCWRDCGNDGKKSLAKSDCGLFDRFRRPKAAVAALAARFRDRTPANLKQ